MNTRSVTGKENLIEDFIIEKDFDFFFSTETWLRPCGDEVKISNMTPPAYSTVSAPRQTGGPGGGIGVTFKDIFKSFIKTSICIDFITFECLKCDVHVNNFHLTSNLKKKQARQAAMDRSTIFALKFCCFFPRNHAVKKNNCCPLLVR